MSKIYTKTGDKGKTSLLNGERVEKCSIHTETMGSLDELNTRIGLLCAFITKEYLEYPVSFLRDIQGNLQKINSYIACSKLPEPNFLSDLSDIDKVLENEIDILENENTPLTKFILPGVTVTDAQAHSCRTQARDAERQLIKFRNILGEKCIVPESVFKYMNRSSDYFFVLARWLCHMSGNEDCFM